MRLKVATLFLLLSFFIALPLFGYGFFLRAPMQGKIPDVFVGVDVAYADFGAIKRLVDKVSSYTNIFVIGSTGISDDQIKLEETCQYLSNQDMQFIIYTDAPRSL